MPTPKNLETTRFLRVNYTDAERLEIGKKLGDELAELRSVNSDFDAIKSSFKSKISACESKIEDLSQKVSTGYRVEEVKCHWLLGISPATLKFLIRDDTSDTVETVEMTAADKQATLEL